MSDGVWRVASYRLATTLRRDLRAYLSIVVLVGLIGGIALASIQAARRTQAAYPTFLQSTSPSNLDVAVYSAGGGPEPSLTTAIAGLPDVEHVATGYIPHAVPLAPDGVARTEVLSNINFVGSPDGWFHRMDRLTIVRGRPADPNRLNQLVVDATAARLLGVHVGSTLPMGVFTPAQAGTPAFGRRPVKPLELIQMHVVGIAVENTYVVEDDVDRAFGFAFLTPALLRHVLAIDPVGDNAPYEYALQLRGGASNVAAVEGEVRSILPTGAIAEFHVTAVATATVELTVRPMSLALGGFGVVAALACLVLGMQAIARLLREGEDDRLVLRVLGATNMAAVTDALVCIAGAVIAGTAVAIAIAIALSPLSPIGPVRPVYPHRGVAFDWSVYLLGAAVAIGVLMTAALVQGARLTGRRDRARVVRPSMVAQGAATAGLPVTSVVGIRLALEPGSGRTAVPLRSVLLGTVVAVTLVTATLTFSSSFQTLISSPRLYGWNWSYALLPTNQLPLAATSMLHDDPDVTGWAGFDYNIFTIDRLSVPVLMERVTNSRISPPVLTGHAVQAPNQIVIGAATLAALHRHVGQWVEVSYGSPSSKPLYVAPQRLRIVGTATLPAIGYASQVAEHTSMGTGALFSEAGLPRSFTDEFTDGGDPNLEGAELAFVRLRATVSSAAGRKNLDRLAARINALYQADPNATGNSVVVLGVQRPAQIVNYQTIGSTPVVLAAGLALGALAALALTLSSSVRRRRRDLAVLRALGMTTRQLAATITWQAAVTALVGVVVGVPLGVALGRRTWILFAQSMNAVPDPTTPALALAAVALGTMCFAVCAAQLPGRTAGRTKAAVVLRAD